MKAIQIEKPGIVREVQIEKPVPSEGEVLLKINIIGLCGSDMSSYLGKNPMVQYPLIPGHEISATITEIGNNVPDTFNIGEKVTVVPYTNCGTCSSCKNGRAYACRYNQTLGVQRDGALVEFITVPWQKIIKASSLNEKELALAEPLTVGFHAIARGEVTDSDTVMVLGCGMIGTGAIIRAALRGAKVIAVDIDDSKLAIAKELGAEFTINSLNENVHDKIEAITDGHGPSVVVEAAGNPKTYLMAVKEVAFTGRIVCIGYVKDEVSFATKLFVQKEIDIRGSRNATASDFEAVIKYLESGRCPVDKLITKTVKIEDTQEVFKYWQENLAKVLKILVEV